MHRCRKLERMRQQMSLLTVRPLMAGLTRPSDAKADAPTAETLPAPTRYVAADGSATHDGLTEKTAWTFSHAVKAAKAGDVVYIKAGSYKFSSHLPFANSGTAAKPITWIGYKDQTGGQAAFQGSTFKYGDTVDASALPLFEGVDATATHGLTVNRDHHRFYNLQFTSFNIAINVTGNHNVFSNMIWVDLGDQKNDGYSGSCIRVSGDYNSVDSSYCENVSAQAYTLGGNYNRIAYSEHHNDNVGGMTDYYFLISGAKYTHAKHNIIEHCKAFRYHNGSHTGHGFDIKGGNNNIIRNSSAYRTQVESMFKTTHHNLYENLVLEGSHAALLVFNGAHDNTYRNIHIKGPVYQGISLNIQDDGASNDPEIDAHIGPFNNTFVNIIIENSTKMLSVGEGSLAVNVKATSDNNRFYNCVWAGNTQSLDSYIDSNGFEFVNCSFSGNTASKLISLGGSKYPVASLDAKFENCNFYNNKFPAPSGAGAVKITTHNPKFVDPKKGDYRLQSTSPLIDIGRTTPHNYAFDGTPRPKGGGFDIGAFER